MSRKHWEHLRSAPFVEVIDVLVQSDAAIAKAKRERDKARTEAREAYARGYRDAIEAAAQVVIQRGFRIPSLAKMADRIRALTPAASTGETSDYGEYLKRKAAADAVPYCTWCGKYLVRGPVGGGHFDWLECKCTAPAEPSGERWECPCGCVNIPAHLTHCDRCLRQRAPSPARPSEARIPVLPVDDAAERRIEGLLRDARPNEAVCKTCYGRGANDLFEPPVPCKACGGTGRTGAR